MRRVILLVLLFGVANTGAFVIGRARRPIDENHCRQNYGSSSLACLANNRCFYPDKQTCCPSGYLADVPSLHGVCCGSEVLNLQTSQMNELTCRTPKQNYAFCNKRSSYGDPCKQMFVYTIIIREQIETNGFNTFYKGTIRSSRWLDTGSSPGNQTVIRIITDRWMPCKDRLTGDDRFLAFSNNSFEMLVRGNFYLSPYDIIIPIHRGSKTLRRLQKRCIRRSINKKTLNGK